MAGRCGYLLVLWLSKTSLLCKFPCLLKLLLTNLKRPASFFGLFCLPCMEASVNFHPGNSWGEKPTTVSESKVIKWMHLVDGVHPTHFSPGTHFSHPSERSKCYHVEVHHSVPLANKFEHLIQTGLFIQQKCGLFNKRFKSLQASSYGALRSFQLLETYSEMFFCHIIVSKGAESHEINSDIFNLFLNGFLEVINI